jgi:hypothetical protein
MTVNQSPSEWDNHSKNLTQTQWIVQNRLSKNIAFVSHMGDIIENGENSGNPSEWNNANTAMSLLENPSNRPCHAHGLQKAANGGNGFFRILAFKPASNTIHVESYSTTLGRAVNSSDGVTT